MAVLASRLHLNYDPFFFTNLSAPFDVLDRPVLIDVHIQPAPPLATLLTPKA
jgi:hypothetical protein